MIEETSSSTSKYRFGKKLLKCHSVGVEKKLNFLIQFGRVKDNLQNNVFN